MYITLPTEILSDFAGLPLMLVTPLTVITQPADLVVNDTSGPVVTSVDFNLNTGSLLLTFDEYTLISSINLTTVSTLNVIVMKLTRPY